MNFKYENILTIGEKVVSPSNLVEIDSDDPYVYLNFKFRKYFDNMVSNPREYPYEIEVFNHPQLNNDVQELMEFIKTPRNHNGVRQYRNGYVVLLYNATTMDYKVIHKLDYLGTVSDVNFNNPQYRPKNILDGLRDILVENADPDLYDFQLIFIFGDKIDYFNGYKFLHNERNVSQKKLFRLQDNEGLYPLSFFNRADTQVNIDKLEMDSLTHLVDGLPMSNPSNYYMTYIGKYLIKEDTFIEEYFTFDDRDSRDSSVLDMKMTLTKYSDVLEVHDNVINPFKNSYVKSNYDKTLEEEYDGEILYGFHHVKPMNVFSSEGVETEEQDIISKGVEYTKRDVMYIYPVSDESTPHFEVCQDVSFGEAKKEDH